MALRRGSRTAKAVPRDVQESAHEVQNTASALLARDAAVPGSRTALVVSPGARRPMALARRACPGVGDCGCGTGPARLAARKTCPPPCQRGGAPCFGRFGRAFAGLECRRAGSVDGGARNSRRDPAV